MRIWTRKSASIQPRTSLRKSDGAWCAGEVVDAQEARRKQDPREQRRKGRAGVRRAAGHDHHVDAVTRAEEAAELRDLKEWIDSSILNI